MDGLLAYAYDAGTDSGTNFTAADMDTMPAENIEPLWDDPSLQLDEPFGMFYLEQHDGLECQGEKDYTIVFASTWSNTTHPDWWAPDGHFSPLVAVAHNRDYQLWG